MDVHPGQTYYFGISDFDQCSFFVSWLQDFFLQNVQKFCHFLTLWSLQIHECRGIYYIPIPQKLFGSRLLKTRHQKNMMITHISVFIPYYKCGFCMFLGGCVSFWGERAEFLPNKDLGILIIHCGTPHESTPTRDFPRAF